jgi:hypothetical protein
MTAPGRYATNDGSFARSTGNAAARGGALIAVAVVIGILLLWKGGVGGDDSSAAIQDDGTSTDEGSGDDSSTETDDGSGSADEDTASDEGDDDESLAVDDGSTDNATEVAPVTATARPVGEVKVMVANGAGESGLAGSQSGILTTAGYVAVAVNAAVATDISTVWYIDGYDADAIGVAEALGGSEIHLRLAGADPVALVREGEAIGNEDAHVWVVLGSDRALG